MDNNIILAELLLKNNLKISVAESCTGGLISKLLTDVPGSSQYFYCGVISYSNESKVSLLSVDQNILKSFGAVSFQCSEAMTMGLKKLTGTPVCITTTGIAGPSGGSNDKPVGLVYAGFFIKDQLFIRKLFFKGDRNLIRLQTANFCIRFLIDMLSYE